jgi:hypothetical protein
LSSGLWALFSGAFEIVAAVTSAGAIAPPTILSPTTKQAALAMAAIKANHHPNGIAGAKNRVLRGSGYEESIGSKHARSALFLSFLEFC